MKRPMGTGAEEAARWLEGKTPALESALAPLVEVNSFTDNVEGGRHVGRILREQWKLPGLLSDVVSSSRYADHLVFRSTGAPLRALAETVGLDALPPLRVVVVSDEEVGSPEGQAIIREVCAGSAAALVFESGRAQDAIITRRKGTGAMEALAHGKAAHAGNHHAEGANAIWAVARFVDAAQQLTDYPRGVTVNVGKVLGGQGKNTVPDYAEAHVDLRFCNRADGEQLLEALRQTAQRAAASVPGTRIELMGGIAREPLERSAESAALLEAYAACARASGLGGGEAGLIGGGSDASTTSSSGIASIDGLGPRGKGFHTVEEHIEVATLVPKAQALARFLALRAGR
jgi:glutamate carboxypeptidase